MDTPKQIDDGGPAFPTKREYQTEFGPGYEQVEGMTLRAWFAGQETLSDYDHPDSWQHYSLMLEAVNGAPPDAAAEPLDYFKWECEARAKMRFMRADAMLAARSK